MTVKKSGTRLDGSTQKAYYRCTASKTSGRCSVTHGIEVGELDRSVLSLVERELLQADTVEKALDAELAEAGQIAVPSCSLSASRWA